MEMDLIEKHLIPLFPYLKTALPWLTLILFISVIYLFLRTREMKKHIAHYSEKDVELQLRIAKLTTLLTNERKQTGEKLAILEEARETLRLQFKTLAQKIFDEKSRVFKNENKESVSAIIQPLQNQLVTFQKRIDDIQVNDVRERMSLKQEIVHLKELNQQINKEAINLTRALKGDKKIQGNWGELVLERVLESSGLRKGHEYSVQGSFRNKDNNLLRPDVVVHLPDNKNIIIDSKVSLAAWEKYINCESEEEKATYLKEHIRAIERHITQLSTKDYSAITELHSLDFVLLFMPIDSSFMAAFDADETLFTTAFEKRIIVVTTTTLLATLKTIENIWRFEHQNQNAKRIAEAAGTIYDKLCGYLEDMEKIGRQLATTTSTYDAAMTKLCNGRGNLVSQAENLKELGVQAKKSVPRSLSAQSDGDLAN